MQIEKYVLRISLHFKILLHWKGYWKAELVVLDRFGIKYNCIIFPGSWRSKSGRPFKASTGVYGTNDSSISLCLFPPHSLSEADSTNLAHYLMCLPYCIITNQLTN